MKLLFVNCYISQRGTGSRTHALAEAFLTAFLASHPGWETEEVTPETLLALKPFDPEMLDRRTPWPRPVISAPRCTIWPGSSGARTRW